MRNCVLRTFAVSAIFENSGGNFAKFWGASAEGTRFVAVYFGMPPQKIFKIWIPEMAFAAF
jgi:hypothetical protein